MGAADGGAPTASRRHRGATWLYSGTYSWKAGSMARALLQTIWVCAMGFVVSACAGQRLTPVVASSTTSIDYAIRYPDLLGATADRFVKDKQRARELTSKLPREAPRAKPDEPAGLVLRVIDEADLDGRRDAYVRAQRSQRELVAFWESERGAIASQISTAANKQAAADGCTRYDAKTSVPQALREGVTRQLEEHARKESAAQVTLEQGKSRLSPATRTALRRTAEDVAQASYLVYVGLVEDAAELQRLLEEHPQVVATLQNVIEYERGRQSAKLQPHERKASQTRVAEVSARIAAADSAKVRAENALRDYEVEVENARVAYQQARASLREVSRAGAKTPRTTN